MKVLSLGQKNIKYRIPNLSVNSVLLPDNLLDVLNFLKFIRTFNPKSIILQHPQFSSIRIDALNKKCWKSYLDADYKTCFHTRKEYSFDENYIMELKQTINKIKSNRDFDNVYFFPDLDSNDISNYYSDTLCLHVRPELLCIKPWSRPSISSSGEVVLCIEYSIGNIVDNNFFEIWHGEKAKKLRDILIEINKFPLCSRCCDLYNPFGGGAGGFRNFITEKDGENQTRDNI